MPDITLREACKRVCDAIEDLGHRRACSYIEDYDGTGDVWRDALESRLLEPLDAARQVLRESNA